MKKFLLLPLSAIIISNSLFAETQIPSDWQQKFENKVNEKKNHKLFVDGSITVIDNENSTTKTYGRADQDSLFEIGSLTKTFTGIIFAKLILEKKVSPSDLVEKYIPELTGKYAGSIRLDELATHTSGLSKIPANIDTESSNPYSTYSAQKLINGLKYMIPVTGDHRPFPIVYSNTGFSLLGIILCKVENLGFNELINKHITGPLEMKKTRVNREVEKVDNFVYAHTSIYSKLPIGQHAWEILARIPHWTFSTGFEAAGGLISTPKDMELFLNANLHINENTVLGQAIKLSQEQFWGWDTPIYHSPSLFKNGGTGGFRSDLIIDHNKNFGIVLLTNINDEPEDLLLFLSK